MVLPLPSAAGRRPSHYWRCGSRKYVAVSACSELVVGSLQKHLHGCACTCDWSLPASSARPSSPVNCTGWMELLASEACFWCSWTTSWSPLQLSSSSTTRCGAAAAFSCWALLPDVVLPLPSAAGRRPSHYWRCGSRKYVAVSACSELVVGSLQKHLHIYIYIMPTQGSEFCLLTFAGHHRRL